MKSMMILGAVVGFAVGVGGSLAGDCTGATTLWHAGVAALVGGILARWWSRLWFISLADALEQQRRDRAQAASETKPANKA
jgi:hypothetical protein